jgi:hypothetical protein
LGARCAAFRANRTFTCAPRAALERPVCTARGEARVQFVRRGEGGGRGAGGRGEAG